MGVIEEASAIAPILALSIVEAVENAKVDSLTPIEAIVARYAAPVNGTIIEANAATCAGELIPGSRSAIQPRSTPSAANFRMERSILFGSFWAGSFAFV